MLQDIKSNPVMVYMKGVPDAPMCGFSNAVVQILKTYGKTSVQQASDCSRCTTCLICWPYANYSCVACIKIHSGICEQTASQQGFVTTRFESLPVLFSSSILAKVNLVNFVENSCIIATGMSIECASLLDSFAAACTEYTALVLSSSFSYVQKSHSAVETSYKTRS